MRDKIKPIYLLILGMMMSINAFAQKDYAKELKEEIVKIEAGKFVATDYELMTFANGNNLQIKITASCPVDVIHRDNFIGIYSTLSTAILLSMVTEAGVEMPDMKELDELIGDPDISLNFVMTKNGIQLQTKTAEGNQNITMQWSEVFQ